MISQYYSVLGVTGESTIADIKKAYRTRALRMHPDRNKDENAHEQFILLTEAYEYLIKQKNRSELKQQTITYEDWQTNYQDEARERAKKYARMRYNDYVNSDIFKTTEALNIIFDHIQLLFFLFIILGSPILGYYLEGTQGVVVGSIFSIIALVLTLKYWVALFSSKGNANFHSLWASIILIGSNKAFQVIFTVLLNTIFFLRVTLNAALPSLAIISAFCLISAGVYYLVKYLFHSNKSISSGIIGWCFVPALLNLFFLVNHCFSTNPHIEHYSFVHKTRPFESYNGKTLYEKQSYIYLENNQYENIYWYRFFTDFESMKNSTEITYVFEDGLFGIKVLKSYEFN